MIAANPKSICEQARRYYYDYLYGEGQESVPGEILRHVGECGFCQAEVKRLRFALAEGERADGGSARRACLTVTTNLRLHFTYDGAFVNCRVMKPFLASLAVPTLKVAVPTPITVHLDKCRHCSEDLKQIRGMNLTNKQLCRLSRLFAEEAGAESGDCSEVEDTVESVAAMRLEGVSSETLRHMCLCPACRERLCKERERLCKCLSGKGKEFGVRCGDVSAADIFDYVVPYGVDADGKRRGVFDESLRSHVVSCPKCLDRMQSLHSKVYGMVEREESGIVTRYKVRGPGVAAVAGRSEKAYEDWPIEVRVFGKSEDASRMALTRARFARVLKDRVSALNLKQFMKPAVAAAAIFIVALLVFSGPTARAVGLGQIYEALAQIKNVCIIRSGAEETGVSTEVWVSREWNVKMFKTGQKFVLWDIKNKSKKSRDLVTGSVTTAAPDDDVLAGVEGTMDAPWGLVPFDDISNLPKGAEWKAVADGDVERTIPRTRVYDLRWAQERPDASVAYIKWRGFIDIETRLPKRVELWEKASEGKYGLLRITEIRYPTANEVEAAIRGAGF